MASKTKYQLAARPRSSGAGRPQEQQRSAECNDGQQTRGCSHFGGDGSKWRIRGQPHGSGHGHGQAGDHHQLPRQAVAGRESIVRRQPRTQDRDREPGWDQPEIGGESVAIGLTSLADGENEEAGRPEDGEQHHSIQSRCGVGQRPANES
jgi:hypothetical protein